jgi:hypothetical protein
MFAGISKNQVSGQTADQRFDQTLVFLRCLKKSITFLAAQWSKLLSVAGLWVRERGCAMVGTAFSTPPRRTSSSVFSVTRKGLVRRSTTPKAKKAASPPVSPPARAGVCKRPAARYQPNGASTHGRPASSPVVKVGEAIPTQAMGDVFSSLDNAFLHGFCWISFTVWCHARLYVPRVSAGVDVGMQSLS